MLRKSKKKQKLLTKESIIHKTANKFVTYGGYIPELDMVLNDGYYFKTYVLDEINTGGILHEMALHDKTMENEQIEKIPDGKNIGRIFFKTSFSLSRTKNPNDCIR